ncbi:MAG: OB-fold domain-containing protein [Acidimicrobiia bacterium]
MTTGILSYGAYIPYFRLPRGAIAAALGTPPFGGERAVASYDEDATSMGVEAARIAMRGLPDGPAPELVLFATADPPYLDKTNATAIHAALDLDTSVAAYDMVGSVRSGVGVMRAGLTSGVPALVVRADVRTGLAGGADERDGGDAAAAFVMGRDEHGPVLAEHLGTASATGEFLDRWRIPGEPGSHVWEERFGEHAYVPLAEQAFADAMKNAGVTPDAVDHLVVAGLQTRAVRRVAKGLGTRPEALVDDLSATVGNTGTAHSGVLLASVLDRAEPDRLIAVVVLADGADVVLFRTSDALSTHRASPTVAEQIESGRDDLAYDTYLTWRGHLHREPPRRPDPIPPAAPPALRTEGWKFAFVGSKCRVCGTRNLPPARVCVSCHTADQMDKETLADVPGTIATYTVDRLAPSLNPPVVVGVIDFDGGGRYQCELTDVDPGTVAIGNRVEMTFRRIMTAAGVHNYFWKARPGRAATGE